MLRTHASVISSAQQALETGAAVDGIMQLSPLAAQLDLVSSIPMILRGTQTRNKEL